jgi:para-aminobenzoate synthetase component 1
MARYDILSASPHRSLVLEDPARNAFEWVRDELGEPAMAVDDIPFAGGALGYWGYDLGRPMFSVPDVARDAEHLPLMVVGIYDWALVIDHQLQRAKLVSHLRFPETQQLLLDVRARLEHPIVSPSEPFKIHGNVESNFTRQGYERAYNQVQRYLQAGDCYQINLAQRFSAQAEGDAFEAYLHMRKLSPAPYSAFMDLPNVQILCASPERFLSVQNGIVETKPIKGTRPRGSDKVSDQRLADELASHSKDRAENLMIVDLLRNDLGKSCVPGSVRVPKLFEVESYANVHHLVSTVRGKLDAGFDALDVLRDCFPGGSITGAPKQRAMHIIEQLEPNRRGVYCGAIGYIGFDGNMDTNIVIRTLIYSGGEIRCWAGGGIVADSQCEAEYQETLDKASAMLKLLHKYGGEYDMGNKD